MSELLPVILTSKDFVLLENLLQVAEPFPGAASLIRSKLARADLVFPKDIPADTITVDSRVRYLTGSGTVEATLVTGSASSASAPMVELTSPHGLALIGARVGQQIRVLAADGSVETLVVEAVIYQPERERPRPSLTLVSHREPAPNVTVLKRPAPSRPDFDGDDPGPSAA